MGTGITVGVIVAVLVGLSQVVKQLGLPSKYLPLANLILGIIAGLVFVDGTIQARVAYGIMTGLSSAGLFDQTKIVTSKTSTIETPQAAPKQDTTQK